MFDEYFSIGSVAVYSFIALGGAGLALLKGFTPIDVDRWADSHGIRLTEETRRFVTHRLNLGKRIRTIGFVIGWLVPYVIFWIRRDLRIADGPFSTNLVGFAFVIGYLLAAVLSEVWFAYGETASGTASLERRTLEAYLPRWALMTPRLAAAGALVMVAAYALLPWKDEGFGPTIPSYLRTALLLVASIVLIEMIQRLVVRRRQPFTSAEMVEADDALRSASVRILAGVAVGVSACFGMALVWQLGTRTEVQVIRWVAPFLGFALLPIGLRAFEVLSDPMLRWRVRRHRATQPA